MEDLESKKDTSSPKELSDLIGEFRFTQKYVYVTLLCIASVISWHSITVAFLAPSVDHYCYDDDFNPDYVGGVADADQAVNYTGPLWRDEPNFYRPPLTRGVNLLPWDNDTTSTSTALPLLQPLPVLEDNAIDPLSNRSLPLADALVASPTKTMMNQSELTDACSCTRWRYSHKIFAATLTEKLDLVCDRAWLASFGSSLYMFGGLLGSIIFGQVADSFGRRTTMLALIIPTALSNVLILATNSYYIFAIGQFFCGAAGTGLFNICFVLMMETVGAEYRSVLGTSIEFSFSTGHLMLLVAAYLLRDWFYIQAVALVITSLLGIMIWYLPESPSWLLVSGRDEQARKTILKIAKLNGLPVDDLDRKTDQLREQITKNDIDKTNDRKYTVLDLFWTPRLRKWSLIILAYCFMTGFIFYGISLNIGIFGTDLFMDFFLSTVITYPAGAACIFIVRHFSRKKTLGGIALGTGIVCILYIAAMMGPEWLHITIVTLAKCLITPAFPVSNTYLAELFPTPVRSLGMGAGGLTARVGAAAAPFMKELGALSDSRVPMAVFGGVAILCGISVVFLPETKDRKLPDTIEEREQFELLTV